MNFTKMQGLGNDFVIISATEVPVNVTELAKEICDRHFGVGADGLVFILPSDVADIQMRIFNADGSESEQCGNAVRCVAKYYSEHISNNRPDQCTVETQIGMQKIWLQWQHDQVNVVTVDMGEPILEAARIPVVSEQYPVITEKIVLEEKTFQFAAVSMGNPHVVIEVEEATAFPVEKWGPQIEFHPLLPQKANVEFITVDSPREITMRVWERAVGQTLACGSGACAVLVATVLQKKTERQVIIHLLGGDLHIEWRKEDNHVYMSGPASYVFSGKYSSTI